MTVKNYPALGETVYRETLASGMRVMVIPRPGITRKAAYLAVGFGSIHTAFEADGQKCSVSAGTAHYLEHKMFDMPDGTDITQAFAGHGASVNAFTDYDMTAYYFTGADHFEQCLELLLQFVLTPYFTEETVEKERGIIEQEILMNLDTPESVSFDNLNRALYRDHPIREPILGSCESIRGITPETLKLCHSVFYTPSNMVLCISGDLDPEHVIRLTDEILQRCAPIPGERPPKVVKTPMPHEEMRSVQKRIEAGLEVAMPSAELGFKAEPCSGGYEQMRQELTAELAAELLFGETSELYLQLYEDGVIDPSFGGGFESIDGAAMLVCSGDTEEPELLKKAVLAHAHALTESGLGERDLLRMKRSELGRRLREMDSVDEVCTAAAACELSGCDFFEFPAVLADIAAQEVTELIGRCVTEERCAMSLILPVSE